MLAVAHCAVITHRVLQLQSVAYYALLLSDSGACLFLQAAAGAPAGLAAAVPAVLTLCCCLSPLSCRRACQTQACQECGCAAFLVSKHPCSDHPAAAVLLWLLSCVVSCAEQCLTSQAIQLPALLTQWEA
jgi:hypothetical protein